MLQYYSQIVETDTPSLEFSRKFPTFTLRTMILSQICPSPSAMLSHCNTQINFGEGKTTHKCLKTFDKYFSSQSWTYYVHS